ncbi:MAG: TIGR01777 family oxidoreductase [Verrucomicrobiota bacterium]
MQKQLQVGITGASGFLGQAVVEALGRAGHRCVAFSRSPERPVHGCAEVRRFAPGEPPDLEGLDAVVHLAGESLMGRPSKRKREAIMESRRAGTHALVDGLLAAGARGPKTLVSASAVGFYGDKGEATVDENAPAGSGFLAEVTQVWEAEARRAETGAARVVILRFGVIVGEHGGMLKALHPVFRLGLGATLGSGRQWVSWVDVRDAARLAVFALENGQVHGVLNATSPVPLRASDFTWAMARRLHCRAPWRIPSWIIRVLFGPMAGIFLDSQRVLPRRAEALGFAFEHRGVGAGAETK